MTSISIGSNSRQAWTLVLGLGLVMAISFGVTFSAFSILTLPIIEVFHSSHEQAARVATVFMVTMTLAMPAAGWLLDHVSPRWVMTIGALVTSLGYLVAARSPDLDSFTAAIALCGVGVGASTYVPAFILVTHWISSKRQGLAFGILLAITGVGGIIFPILLTRMIAAFGLRGTMEMCAAMVFLICVPLLFWLARMPQRAFDAGQQVNVETNGDEIGNALRMPRYWLWVLMFLLITLSSLSVLMGLVPYLMSVGYSAGDAATIYAAISAMTIVGSLLFGALSTRWGVARTMSIGVVIGSVGILCLLMAPDPTIGMGAIIVFVFIWGTTFNLVNQFSPTLLMEIIGQRNFGSLLGIGNLISGLGAAMGPTIFGHLVDTTKTYVLSLSLCAAMMAIALLPLVLHRSKHQMCKALASLP